ncbi:MAG: histidinol-phosphate transaminase [Pseudomonadota bacterium]
MTILQYRKALHNVPLYKAGASSLQSAVKPIKLSSNENAFGASPAAIEAFKSCADKLFKYPDGSATDLRRAIAARYHVDENHIICGAGSDNILELCALCFLENGDEGIISTHTFPLYNIIIQIAGGVPVKIPYREDLSHDVDAIIAASNAKTKIIFIANPDSPTGQYLTKDEILKLVQNVPKHVLIVIDEAYYEFADADDYTTSLPLVQTYENVVVTRTFSKMFGLAALRVGWGYLPQIALDALSRARSPFNVSMPSQMAAIAALEDIDWQEKNIADNLSARQRLDMILKDQNYHFFPSQANFILVKFPDASKADAYFKEHNIIVRHMTGNAMPDYIRISLGTEDQMDALEKALEKMPEALKAITT